MPRSTVCVVAALAAACTVSKEQPRLEGQDVRLTLIHTSDIHSRLFPYDMVPLRTDENLGLHPDEGPYGGIARIAHIVKRERAQTSRSLWLDSGDCFQGAPVFNLFQGEAELRALTEAGLDVAVIGNHEFDLGSDNLYEQMLNWAGFPMLAANYYFLDPDLPQAPKLAETVKPYQLFDLDGVTVAVIGMANWSSMTGIFEGGNSLGLRPLDDAETVVSYVNLLRPVADVVILVSHLGLDEDEGLAAHEVEVDMNEELPTDGVDIILGGHLHIVLAPPKVLNVDEHGHPTIMSHSGAFAKYVGRLDVLVRKGEDNADPARRSYLRAWDYQLFPVTCGRRGSRSEACPNPIDPQVGAMLQPYSLAMNQELALAGTMAYVSLSTGGKIVRNDPSGGDSQLGNLVARAMQRRLGVDADFAITNSLGIRADFEPGPLTLDAMYNVFPFENSITVMYLSGAEVRETLDFVARKSSSRGCRTQAQVAGIYFTMVCGPDPRAEDIFIGDECRTADGSIDPSRCVELIDEGLYRVAVNDYISRGGSGFTVLKRNTSKQDTQISLRSALMDFIRQQNACATDLTDDSGMRIHDLYGPIACLDESIEPHDERILTRLE